MKMLFLSSLFVVCSLFLMNTEANAQTTSRDYSIMNNTGSTVTYLYFSPANVNTFGKNVMTSPSIVNSNSFNYTWNDYPDETCTWDVMYTTSDGTKYYMEDVDLCKSTSLTLSNGMTTINNNSDMNTK